MGGKLVAVVLNWNRRDDTRACIESLLKQTHPVSVLLVDNGSTECPLFEVTAGFGGIDVLALPTNLGFARGMNAGIERALAQGAELVWICNNDTVMDPGCAAALVRAMEEHPDAALVSPLIYDARRPGLLSHGGGGLALAKGKTWHRYEGLPKPPHDAPYESDFIEGCAPLIRADDLRAQGGFDPEYVSYWEDVDWCLAARARGRKLLMVPDARIVHKVSGSSGVESPYALYHRARNRFRCARKHGSRRQRAAIVANALLELPVAMYHTRRASGQWAPVRAWVRGTWHGILGRSG